MMGKIGLLGALVFLGALLVVFFGVSYSGYSAEQETGTTTLNVTIRGWVSISATTCITNGISFNESDQGTDGNNATCNSGYWLYSGTGYNITINSESTVNINFTHASNRSNLTTGTYNIDIGNVTYNSNSTNSTGAPTGNDLWDNSTATALSTSWIQMEDCDNNDKTNKPNCWVTYFLNVPSGQEPGDYETGYCWCGRQTTKAESLCGTCT